MKNKTIKVLATIVVVLLFGACEESDNEFFGSWTAQETVSSNWLQGVCFNNATQGWIVGWNNTLFSTVDGGVTWNEKSINSMSSFHFYDVAFADDNNGCIVGQANSEPVGGVIFTTDNGGATWNALDVFSDMQIIRSISFADAQNGWAVGGDGVILHTSDAGKTWQQQSSGTTASFYNVHSTDRGNVWVCGAGGTIRYSSDGGQSWISQNTVDAWINDIFFIDPDHGWAVTAGGESKILATKDGGQNWEVQYIGDLEYLNSINFTSQNKGWACGESGVMYYTNDGTNWQKKNAPSADEINDLFFVSENNGWAVGYNGYMIHFE
ncbi:MAG: YCF48-related protein [Bacteroidota bacterium]|nr:YCF48-related protein [Bacteroidota bacterium]